MKYRIPFSSALMLVGVSLFGQGELPDILNENLVYPNPGCEQELSLRSKLKGAFIQYTVSGPYKVSNTTSGIAHSGTVESERELHFKYKIPVINNCDYKLLLGHTAYHRDIEFSQSLQSSDQLFQIENKALKSNRFSIYNLIALDDRTTLAATFSAAYNGDYEGFVNTDKRYAIYRGVALYSRKSGKNDEWGVGLYYKNGFRSSYVLPFGIYNKTFNDKWGLEALILSRVYGRYNANKNSIFLFGVEYTSRDFSIDIDFQETTANYNMKWPKVNLKGIWQRQFIGSFWLELQAGLQYNLDPTLEVSPFFVPGQNVSVTSHNLMFSVGLFFTPPESWLE